MVFSDALSCVWPLESTENGVAKAARERSPELPEPRQQAGAAVT